MTDIGHNGIIRCVRFQMKLPPDSCQQGAYLGEERPFCAFPVQETHYINFMHRISAKLAGFPQIGATDPELPSPIFASNFLVLLIIYLVSLQAD